MNLNSQRLREIDEQSAEKVAREIKRHPIYLVLEDILDTYNVGGFFRLADAVAAEKIYLCGNTSVPPCSSQWAGPAGQKIVKASVGTYKVVPWEYKKTVKSAMSTLRKVKGMKIVAVEQHKKSRDYRKLKYNFPVAFLIGNENWGLKPASLKLADEIVEIPMYGANKSLNAAVAAGIIVYRALENEKHA